jgi:hypothetical protein
MLPRCTGWGINVGLRAGEINVVNPPTGGGIGEIIAGVPGVRGASVTAVVVECLLLLPLLDPDPPPPDVPE